MSGAWHHWDDGEFGHVVGWLDDDGADQIVLKVADERDGQLIEAVFHALKPEVYIHRRLPSVSR